MGIIVQELSWLWRIRNKAKKIWELLEFITSHDRSLDGLPGLCHLCLYLDHPLGDGPCPCPCPCHLYLCLESFLSLSLVHERNAAHTKPTKTKWTNEGAPNKLSYFLHCLAKPEPQYSWILVFITDQDRQEMELNLMLTTSSASWKKPSSWLGSAQFTLKHDLKRRETRDWKSQRDIANLLEGRDQ